MASFTMVDIIIPCWNQIEHTENCIKSIFHHADPKIPFRIIAVNNGSVDNTHRWLQSNLRNEWDRIANFPDNRGWCAAINKGIQCSNSPFVVMLNNDTIVSKDWLAKLLVRFDNPRVGAVGPATDACSGPQNLKLGMLYETQDPDQQVNSLVFFCAMFRREALNDVEENGRVVDEQFSPGGSEDIDLSIRLRKKNWKLLIAKDCFVHHEQGKTLPQLEQFNVEDRGYAYFKRRDELLRKKWGDSEVNLAITPPPYLVIGMPTKGYVHHTVMRSVMALRTPERTLFIDCNGGPVQFTRNEIVERFLQVKGEWLLFMDDDMVASPDAFLRLHRWGKKIISGSIYRRRPPYSACLMVDDHHGTYSDLHLPQGVIKCDAVGAAFCLIHRSVFETVPYPWFWFTDPHEMPEHPYGEDINFCRKAAQYGFEIWADADVDVTHLGDPLEVNRRFAATYYEANKDGRYMKIYETPLTRIDIGVDPSHSGGNGVKPEVKADAAVVCDDKRDNVDGGHECQGPGTPSGDNGNGAGHVLRCAEC